MINTTPYTEAELAENVDFADFKSFMDSFFRMPTDILQHAIGAFSLVLAGRHAFSIAHVDMTTLIDEELLVLASAIKTEMDRRTLVKFTGPPQ